MSSTLLDLLVQKVHAQTAVPTSNTNSSSNLLNDDAFQGVISEWIIRGDCESIYKILGETDEAQFQEKVNECVSKQVQERAIKKQECEDALAAASALDAGLQNANGNASWGGWTAQFASVNECLQGEAAKSCDDERTLKDGQCVCAFWETVDGECLRNDYGTLWINCSSEQLVKGNCSLNVSQLLWIRTEQSWSNNLMTWLQDATLGATSFIGTVLTIGLVAVALRYIFGGLDASFVGNAKKWFSYAIIGFFLVVFSYTIVRLVQYLAQG